MDSCTTVNVTGDLKVRICGWRLNTRIIVENTGTEKKGVSLDVDKWTELKKSIFYIDEEFRNRFNYQYSTL